LGKRVEAIGPRDAKIAIVGEAPGADEELSGIPFIGAAGRLLNGLLHAAGIDRNDCYITNVVKYRPPNNKIDQIHKLGLSMERCAQELREELVKNNHNVIVPLGNTALRALTTSDSITKWRGSILKGDRIMGAKVIPTIHPAAALRMFHQTALIAIDLKKVKRESEFPDFRNVPQREYIIKPTFSKAMDELKRIGEAKKVTIDIETPRSAPYTNCFGISDSHEMALCLPFLDHGNPVYPKAEEISLWTKLKEIMTNPNVGKVIQNAMFEMDVLFKWFGQIYPVYMDTMIAHHICYPELPKGLDMLASIYTNEPYYKDDAKDSNYEGDSLWLYNCRDVAVTHEVMLRLEEELEEANLTDFYHGYQSPFLAMMWKASNKGVLTDKKRIFELRDKYEAEIVAYQKLLDNAVGHPLNVNSALQVRKYLYQELKLPPRLNKQTGSITANDEALQRLAVSYPRKEFDYIMKIRELRKVVSTYLKDLSDPDGRMRTSWRMTGTETGRISSSKNIRGTGGNLQNIPKYNKEKVTELAREGLRDIFIADPGHSFVVGDLSQSDARYVAYLSHDKGLMQIFKEGGDIHKAVAAWVNRIPIEAVTPAQRSVCKHVVHGANYDIGPRQFAWKVNIKESEGKWVLNQYHLTFPGIHTWHDSIKRKLRETRTLISPFGRRRIFFGRLGDSVFREGYAQDPQSCTADHLGLAGIRIDARLEGDEVLLLQIHDEWVIQCTDERTNNVAIIFKEEAERPKIVNMEPLVVPVDIAIGKDWKHTKEWKDETDNN
jgi:uracil-DNA glycosylase family 4